MMPKNILASSFLAEDSPVQECSLIPGVFGVSVQFLLGVLSFSILIIKFRYFEKYDRAGDVFLRDISKIACGAVWIHGLNLIAATLLFKWFNIHEHSTLADSCDWYFLNIMLDTTLGLGINYLFLKLSQRMFHYICGYYGQHSHTGVQEAPAIGDTLVYGDTESSTETERHRGSARSFLFGLRRAHTEWERQIGIWILIVSLMKVVITIIMLTCHSWLSKLAHALFLPLEGYTHTKLVVVMVIVPIAMNSFQYWVTDGFLECKTIPAEVDIPNKQKCHLIEEHILTAREQTTTEGEEDLSEPLIAT